MTDWLTIKNWDRHQHYKDRCPPWIKLHVKLLNDREFSLLSRKSKCLLMLLWILAAENDGKIKNDLQEIRFRLRDATIKAEEINLLIKKGFIYNNKQMLASACLETETETETETEKRQMFVAPLKNDVIKFFNEKGYSTSSAVKAFNYYDSAGWKDSTGKQVKNWKQKMIGVWFKEENKKVEYTPAEETKTPDYLKDFVKNIGQKVNES